MLDKNFGGHFVKIIFLSYSWQGNESYQSQSVVSGRTSKVTRGFGHTAFIITALRQIIIMYSLALHRNNG